MGVYKDHLHEKRLFEIRLFGQIEVRHGDERVKLPRRKTEALLAYLAAADAAHSRRELYALFCSDADDPPAALRWHLSRLRHALGAEVIQAQVDNVKLNHRACLVDSVEFGRALVANLVGQTTEALVTAVGWYCGEFAAGLSLDNAADFELWLLNERTRLRGLYERGQSELVARFIALERYEDAIQHAQQLLTANPLLEQAHAQLIWLYAQTGQLQAALQQYVSCREILRRELAVEPTPDLRALYDDVRTGRVGRALPAPVPAMREAPDLRRTFGWVGRQEELKVLELEWQSARAGRGRVVLIEAEAGGGKTRLVREFAHSISTPEACVLTGSCYESTRTLPYHPWVELLEARLTLLSDDTLHRWSPFWLEQLSRLLPSLAGRLGRPAIAPPPLLGDEAERLFNAVAQFLFQITAPPPYLIFVDDLQWADALSLQLFHFLARRATQAAVLLVGTFRTEEADDVPALQTLLSDLRRDYTEPRAVEPRHAQSRSAESRHAPFTHMRLPPLTTEAIGELVGRLWQLLPQPLPQEEHARVTTMLAHATGGNALFVTEILRELAHTSTVPATLPVPESVRDLIRRRLRQLPASAHQVIEALALLDAPATVAQAQYLSARSEEETTEALDLALRTRLAITQSGTPPAQYLFSHDIVREAITQQVSDARRRLLHRRAAALLALSAGGAPVTVRLDLAGHVLHHALKGEDDRTVFTWAPLAGEHALHLCAYADALAAYEAAATALMRLAGEGELEAGIALPRELELLLARIHTLHHLGRRTEEPALLGRVKELLARNRHPDARLEAEFELRQAAYLGSTNQYVEAYASAIRANERYQMLGDMRHAAESLVIAGDAMESLGKIPAARRHLEESVALYHSAGDERGENRALSALAWCMVETVEIDAALGYLARSLDIAERQGDVYGRAYACFVLALVWNYYYHSEEVRAYGQEARRLYLSLGNEAGAARALLILAASELQQPNWEGGRVLFKQAFSEAHAQGDGWAEGWIAQFLGRIALAGMDYHAAEHWLQHACELRRAHGEEQNLTSDLAWLGRLRTLQGQIEPALDYTAQAIERLDALQGKVRVWEEHDVYMCRAEALSAAGDTAGAARSLEQAYTSLTLFASRIGDPQVRQGFLDYVLTARIVAAHASGVIKPFPL
jgi:predicted ATPase/DNA-binding SARP family transcriptional activator